MDSIYGLFDATGELRYIGKSNNPKKRLGSHLRDAKRLKTPLYAWINKHGMPEMRVLEANCPDWQEAERRHIADARARGERLLNIADGGDEPFCPPEVRASNWKKLQAHPNTVAQRKINGKWLNDPNRYVDSTFTREMLIRDTHEWVLRVSAKCCVWRVVDKTMARMAAHHVRAPGQFPQWARYVI